MYVYMGGMGVCMYVWMDVCMYIWMPDPLYLMLCNTGIYVWYADKELVKTPATDAYPTMYVCLNVCICTCMRACMYIY